MTQGHVDMLISILPKYSTDEGVSCIKGNSAIAVAKQFGNYSMSNGEKRWARGVLFQQLDLKKRRLRRILRNKSRLTAEVWMNRVNSSRFN